MGAGLPLLLSCGSKAWTYKKYQKMVIAVTEIHSKKVIAVTEMVVFRYRGYGFGACPVLTSKALSGRNVRLHLLPRAFFPSVRFIAIPLIISFHIHAG